MAVSPIENVSDTALWVAAYRALESERPDALYLDPLASKLAGDRGREIARNMPYGNVTAWIMAVRTVVIDRLIGEAIAEGVDTVINLGAGLDTRPYRLSLPKKLRWVEVDFPHMIQLKTEKLVNELPKCELKRIGIDLSDRAVATRLYSELASQTKKAVVITEGVIAYLTNEQAGDLASDLRAIPSFRYWIQDYRSKGWRHPPKLRKKLMNSPFKFQQNDPLAFFAARGWSVMHNVSAVEEGERLGRKFPFPFPFNLIIPLAPKSLRNQVRGGAGYALLQAGAVYDPSSSE